MQIEQIIDLWEIDSRIDKSKLDDEVLNTNNLLQKYMKIFVAERTAYKKYNLKKRLLLVQLEDYYTGKIDGKDIGREPFPLQLTKAGAEKRAEADKELLELEFKITQQETKVLILKDIIEILKYRGNNIRTALDFIKWQSGID